LDIVTPGFFATLGVPLLQGRDFTQLDKEGAKPVVIIDDLLARRLFGGENPVGKMLVTPLHSQDVPFEIIGVVRASPYYDLHQPPPPTYFYNLEQVGPYMPTLHVRVGAANTESVLAEVRREFDAIDRNVPIFDVKTLQDRANDSLAQQRLVTDLAAAFGILALGLVAMGLYGLIAFSVARRTREIGIRLALGAERMQIMGLIARQGMAIVFIGVALGLPAAFVLTRLMAGLLYGVQPDDPLTFFGVALVLGTVAALATVIPARPATKVDPMVALRYE
jgi:predicted permease